MLTRSTRVLHRAARRLPRRNLSTLVDSSESVQEQFDPANPTAEHRALRKMVQEFTKNEVEPQALQYNREERLNRALFERAGELGLLGVTADPEYGGAGMDATAACIVHEELSYSDPAFCLSYLAHSQLFVNNLARNGSVAQLERWLPRACSGEHIGGMGMSEPSCGTDVLAMRTTARAQPDGSFKLNGTKMWITNGAVNDTDTGDVFLVYARTGGPDVRPSQAVSLFVVERGMAGFSLGQRLKDKCGMRASPTAELVFEDVEVPAANLVGKLGGATLCMMRNLEIERVVLAAMSVGIARRSLQAMNTYATERTAFGQKLHSFGQMQRHIGESYAEYRAGKAYLYQTALNLDLDEGGQRLDTDGVKLYCTMMGKNVADRAIQVMGGYGYMGEYAVERLWRDSKLLEIGGGTLESHHKNMVREMAAFTEIA